MLQIEAAGITDVGRKRKGNEDSFFMDDTLRIYVVADGMGGHAAGEVASRLLVETVESFMKQFWNNPAASQLPAPDSSLSPESNMLLSAIHLANSVIHKEAKKNPAYKGMGSTVSAVTVHEDKLVVANVGDSPIYLIRNETVRTVSVPHTMMAEYEGMAPKGAKPLGEHLRHVLTRAMGLKEAVEPAISEIPLSGEDTLVICSDGLSDKVSPEQIMEVVVYERPERACRTLVKMANDRGGDDNITIIILRVESEHKGAEPADEKPTPPEGAAPRKIAVDYDTEDASHRAYVDEIRTDGVFIHTTEAIGVGETLFLSFSLSDAGTVLMLSGTVARREPKGFTVRFDELTEEQRKIIESLRSS